MDPHPVGYYSKSCSAAATSFASARHASRPPDPSDFAPARAASKPCRRYAGGQVAGGEEG